MFINDKILFAAQIDGMSQQDVAKKLDMSQGQISNWLNGKTPISEEAWVKILTKLKNFSKREAKNELIRWRIRDAEEALEKMENKKNQDSDFLKEKSVNYGFYKASDSDFKKIPFYGKVKCGDFDDIFTEADEFRMVHKKNLKGSNKYIMLEASGVSMQGAGIEEGDELLVCLNCKPKKGDICLFEIRGEIVVGYYLKNKDTIEIGKAHKSYPPLSINDSDFRTLGVVISVLRTFRPVF